MLMFVTFIYMVFHNQSVVKKRKEKNFNLITKNRVHSNSEILHIIFTFNIRPTMHHLHWEGISVNSYQKKCTLIIIF